ncbi:hypothetical protein [Staphylococcus phage phiSP119-2]|nr:hypothetical protein [Staphylococcus phage phiSP119-2]
MKYIIAALIILYVAHDTYIRLTANDEIDQYDFRAEVSE